MAKSRKFESVLTRLQDRLKPEFVIFLGDLAQHRSEKFAVECLVDQLHELKIGLSMELAVEISQLCRALKIDEQRRELLEELAGRGVGAASGDVQTSRVCSLDDLVAAEDPVVFGRANGASEVMIVRALREKFGIPLVEAAARLRAGPA